MGILDSLMMLTGRTDPAQQIAMALHPPMPGPPAPPGGQPGGDGSAQPPAAGPSPAGPGAAPGAASPAPPQPQAYQVPQDLGQMFLQLTQRQQASSDFDRHLGLLAASMYPGRRPDIIMNAMNHGGQDPGALFNDFLQIQGYTQEQQRYADLVNNSAAYAKSFNMDPDQFSAVIKAAGPAGAGAIMGKIAEAQMGLTGNLTDKEYKQAVRNFQTQNPGQPLPPELQTEAGFAQQQAENITAGNVKAKDLQADKANFQPALQAYDEKLGLIDQLSTPAMQEGLKEFLGTTGSITPVAAMSPKGKAAWAIYKQIMAGQFAAGVQDFKGAGRITQQELNQDAPQQSTMGQLNQDPEDFLKGMAAYRDRLANHRANLFGAAQYIDDPRLSDEDFASRVSSNYKPGGDLGPKTSARNIPDFSKMSGDDAYGAIAKLPSGKVFIGPDGQAHRKN
jgi:hypothetical protein